MDKSTIADATTLKIDNSLDLTYKELKEINDKLHPKKVRVTITRPVVDNDGNPLDVETLVQFENMLLKNSSGFTVSKRAGVWLSEGKFERFEDMNHVYEMIVDNNPSIIGNLRAQALVIKQEMNQEAVLFTVEPMTSVEFV